MILAALLAVGCGDGVAPDRGPAPGAAGAGEPSAPGCANGALVCGRVVHITPATSYTELPELGPDSLARVGLYSNPALGGDGDSTLMVEQVLSPAPALPFDFELSAPQPPPSDHLQYHLAVIVQQHAEPYAVGDLISETLNIVQLPADHVVLEVQGLEACSAPNVGGACALPDRE